MLKKQIITKKNEEDNDIYEEGIEYEEPISFINTMGERELISAVTPSSFCMMTVDILNQKRATPMLPEIAYQMFEARKEYVFNTVLRSISYYLNDLIIDKCNNKDGRGYPLQDLETTLSKYDAEIWNLITIDRFAEQSANFLFKDPINKLDFEILILLTIVNQNTFTNIVSENLNCSVEEYLNKYVPRYYNAMMESIDRALSVLIADANTLYQGILAR